MIGENGTPETPDWSITMRLDWELEQVLQARLASDNGVRHNLDDVIAELGIDLSDPLPDNIILGAE